MRRLAMHATVVNLRAAVLWSLDSNAAPREQHAADVVTLTLSTLQARSCSAACLLMPAAEGGHGRRRECGGVGAGVARCGVGTGPLRQPRPRVCCHHPDHRARREQGLLPLPSTGTLTCAAGHAAGCRARACPRSPRRARSTGVQQPACDGCGVRRVMVHSRSRRQHVFVERCSILHAVPVLLLGQCERCGCGRLPGRHDAAQVCSGIR